MSAEKSDFLCNHVDSSKAGIVFQFGKLIPEKFTC